MLGIGALGEFALGEFDLATIAPSILIDDADSRKRRKKQNKDQELAFDREVKARADLRQQVTDLLRPKVATTEPIKETIALVPASIPIAAKHTDSEDEILAILMAVL